MMEKKFRDKHRELQQFQEEGDRIKNNREHTEFLQQCVDELRAEKEKNDAKQERTRLEMQAFYQQSIDNRRRQREVEAAERLVEAEKAKEYERKMQEIDAGKRADIEKREQEKARLENLQSQQLRRIADARSDNYNYVTSAQENEGRRFALEIDARRRDQHKKLRHQTQDFLCLQMDDKRLKKEECRRVKHMQLCSILDDVKDFEQEEEVKKLDRKLQLLENRAYVEAQILAKSRMDDRELMSGFEKSMNADLIRVAENALEERDREGKPIRMKANRRNASSVFLG